MPLSPEDFGDSFKNFMNTMNSTGSEKGFFRKKLEDHFQVEPTQLAIVSQTFEVHEQPNLHIAMEQYLQQTNRSSELFGVVINELFGISMADMVGDSRAGMPPPSEGPISYTIVSVGNDETMQCVKNGLFLITDDETPLAALIRHGRGSITGEGSLKLDVMAPNRKVADKFVAEIKTLMRKNNVYRGQILAIEGNVLGDITLRFHPVASVERHKIILPSGLLDRIEKATVRFSQNVEKLIKWKRHLRRGLLLYGPPGTGKTLSAMYLAGAMKGRTMILVTGKGSGLLGKICVIARALQPLMVVIEDVDLIAEDRRSEVMAAGGGRPLLMELMNEMDGIGEDSDIIFLLTTNRPDVLEPALASRPGRVDQSFELPLPDADCRRRLFQLYSEGLPLEFEDFGEFVARTEGASPAFIKELMRLAANFAADEDRDAVSHSHVDEALRELIVRGGKLNQSILGYASSPSPPA